MKIWKEITFETKAETKEKTGYNYYYVDALAPKSVDQPTKDSKNLLSVSRKEVKERLYSTSGEAPLGEPLLVCIEIERGFVKMIEAQRIPTKK